MPTTRALMAEHAEIQQDAAEQPTEITVPMDVAVFVGRCLHGFALALASIRTENLEDVDAWDRDGLSVRVEASPVALAECEHCCREDA